jgi:hypothetical protein
MEPVKRETTASQPEGAARDVLPPVFVLEGGDVSLHNSLADAIGSLEGVDVAHEIYRLFDSQGRRIRLRAEGVQEGRFFVNVGTVHIDSVERMPAGAPELREALVAYLQHQGSEGLDTADLAVLVNVMQQKR